MAVEEVFLYVPDVRIAQTCPAGLRARWREDDAKMIRMRGVRFDPERAEVRALMRGAPLKRGQVLDVGCGDGRLTRRILRAASGVVGIDPDKEQIARARQFTTRLLRRKVRYKVGSAEALPFAPHTFDVVLFSWSL